MARLLVGMLLVNGLIDFDSKALSRRFVEVEIVSFTNHIDGRICIFLQVMTCLVTAQEGFSIMGNHRVNLNRALVASSS